MAEPPSIRSDGNGVQVETENEKFTVMCSCSPQNLESGHFRLLFGQVGKKCTKMHMQGLSFSMLLFCDVLVVVVIS